MSKRFIYQQQIGDRKKAKLDVTASDHNFPLSQNAARSREVTNENTWGDDNDDEILLLASQACEDVYGGQDISSIPDYSIAMHPSSTSTQICEPVPSTSKSAFAFKKPITPHNMNRVKESDRISSPLPGIASKVKNDGINICEDFILSDKICDNRDPNYAYRQLLQLQEENAKLKSENGKLMEKCVTKEGEASILRSQLKTCQVTVDNARIEKIQAHEKAQMEWSEKLLAANNQMQDLRTQLDFKNLEIISIKEKCKMLESSKVKLTQVTIAGNDISASQKLNSSSIAYDNNRKYYNRTKTTSNAVQTDGKSHFLKLSTVLRLDSCNLDDILPLMLEPTMETCSLLDFNEKLRRPVDLSQNKCRMLYAFHQLPSTPHSNKRSKKAKISLPSVYKDVASIIAHQGHTFENNIRLLDIVKEVLSEVLTELDTISQRMTSAFHKEMDEKYIEATNTMDIINKIDLISGRSLIKDEQGILARRLLAILVFILEDSKNFNTFKILMENENSPIIEILAKLTRMCILLDNTSTAMFYSGLLSSMLHLLDVTKRESDLTIVKNIIHSRPMPFVSCQILPVLTHTGNVRRLCTKSGNLRVDYDQGVLLYRNDSCTLQIVYKQIEAALKCAERKEITGAVIFIAKNLLLLYNYISDETEDSSECECQLVLLQVLVYALKICSTYLLPESTADDVTRADARRICVGGANALSGQTARLNCLRYHRGVVLQMADVPEIGNILSEVLSTFQAVPEEPPVSYYSQALIQSFQTFTRKD